MKDYKQIWDSLSTSWKDASFYVCCIDDEDDIRRNGQHTAQFLREVLQITPADMVLEIGCGVARIGRELAPYCAEWHGADISGNMIAYAAGRTLGLSNVYLHELPDATLSIFPDSYFDCVYSTIVFMHLDKTEMFTYMREAYRVLKPDGRVYFDTYNLLAPEAWEEFRCVIDSFPPHLRPGHVSQFSTPQEMRKFMEEAGFSSIHIDDTNPQLVVTLGVKSAAPAGVTPSRRNGSRGTASFDLERHTPKAILGAQRNLEGTFQEQDAGTGAEVTIEDLHAELYATNQYIAELERQLEVKNRHIARLERIIQKHEQLLSALPVRVAMRLRRTLKLPK